MRRGGRVRSLLCILLGFVFLAGALFWLKGERSWLELRERAGEWVESSSEGVRELKDRVAEELDADAGREPMRPLANGTEYTYFRGSGVIPITIHNRSSELHAIVKLEDYSTGEIVAKYFVRAGHEIKKQLPVGKFKLKFATGTHWYGEPVLFGSETERVVMTGAVSVTQKGDYFWIYPASVEINIELPMWSPDRSQSRALGERSW